MSIIIILVLTALTLLNIIAPFSGTAIITPILIGITGDVQKAITFGLFLFTISSVVRAVVFRSNIQWKYVKALVPVSVIASVFGSILSVNIPVVFLILIMIYVTTTFLVQKIKNNKKRTENKWGAYGVGLFTGFLQGTGVVGGSDMRNNFFFARGLTIAEVGATTAVVGAINFIFPISYRLYDGLVTISELSQLLILLPFIIFATIVGKYILKKIPKLTQDIIIYAVIIISLGILIYRLLELLI